MRVNIYFMVDKRNTTSLISYGDVQYTSYSSDWYSVTKFDKTTHRWPSHRISSIEETF